jgi:DNA topoisomerase-1
VTDGSTNATLPKGSDPKTITLDEAVRLIDERAAKGPPAKKGRKKPARKKAK